MADIRKTARTLGVPLALIRKAKTEGDVAALIAEHMTGNGTTSAPATKKATARKKNTSTTRTTRTTSASSKSKPAAKSTRGKAKRSTTASTRTPRSAAKVTPARKQTATSQAGRNMLGSIDYRDTDGWNPRVGSAPDLIIKALAKFKGDREKVFNALKGDMIKFVSNVKRDSTKRTRQDKEQMLRYRIARTEWDFALKTGQHEASTNRIEYGTSENAKPKAKPKARTSTTVKPKATPRKRAATPAKKTSPARAARKAQTTRRTASKRRTTRR